MTTGVNWHKTRERWSARIYRNSKMHNLGYFITEAEAVDARQKAERILDTMQPKEPASERRAEREREKTLQQIDNEFKKRTLLPGFT